MRRSAAVIIACILARSLSHPQQYGWVKVAQVANVSLRSVEFVDSLHGWTGGNAIYRTTNGGLNWTPFGVAMIPKAISMIDSSRGWAVGDDGSVGKIYRTTNGGVTWVQQLGIFFRTYLGTHVQTEKRNTTAGHKLLSSSDTGKIVQTTNNGTSWTERTIADSISYLYKVQFVDSLHGWITGLGPRGAYVLRTVDGGSQWTVVTSPQLFSQVSFIDTQRGWGVHGDFFVYKTTDGGVSWQLTYDGFLEDVGVVDLSFVDSLHGWAFGTTFYQGDLAGTIYHTTDGGYTWTRESVGLARLLYAGTMLDRYHGWAVGANGNVLRYQLLTGVPERLPDHPTSFSLRQNYPNPFNATTSIVYELMLQEHVRLSVYDALGKEVRRMIDELQLPGVYQVTFDGSSLASGVYYYSLTSKHHKETREMILLR